MTIVYSKQFLKQAKKLSRVEQDKLYQRLELFADNTFAPVLRNHSLKGNYQGYRSIDITGDVRALYIPRGDEATFDLVGTHSQLYG